MIRDGIEKDVVEYIGGFIIKKLKDCENVPGQSDWINLVGIGGLKVPSVKLVGELKKLELLFNMRMGKLVDSGPRLRNRLKEDSRHVEVSVRRAREVGREER